MAGGPDAAQGPPIEGHCSIPTLLGKQAFVYITGALQLQSCFVMATTWAKYHSKKRLRDDYLISLGLKFTLEWPWNLSYMINWKQTLSYVCVFLYVLLSSWCICLFQSLSLSYIYVFLYVLLSFWCVCLFYSLLQAKGKKQLFVQLVLDNIWSLYDAVVTRRWVKDNTLKYFNSLL